MFKNDERKTLFERDSLPKIAVEQSARTFIDEERLQSVHERRKPRSLLRQEVMLAHLERVDAEIDADALMLPSI